MTTLVLVRHGHTDTAGKRLTGWTAGVHLNQRGVREAESLVERLDGVRVDAIVSSPLERCRETAAPLAKARGLAVRVARPWIEVNYGDWTGRSISQLRPMLLGEDRPRSLNRLVEVLSPLSLPPRSRPLAAPRRLAGIGRWPIMLAAGVAVLGGAYGDKPGAMLDRIAPAGTPEEVAARVQEYVDAGARHVIISPAARDDTLEVVTLAAEEVLPRLTLPATA